MVVDSVRSPCWRSCALVAATVGVAMSSRSHGPVRVDDRRHHHTNDPHLKLGKGPAQVAVLSALSATTAARSFDVSYRLSDTEASAPTDLDALPADAERTDGSRPT